MGPSTGERFHRHHSTLPTGRKPTDTTGMRLGEGLALQWDDVNFAEKEIRVARALSDGRIEKPKSGHGRTVDMSEQLARILLRLYVQRIGTINAASAGGA